MESHQCAIHIFTSGLATAEAWHPFPGICEFLAPARGATTLAKTTVRHMREAWHPQGAPLR